MFKKSFLAHVTFDNVGNIMRVATQVITRKSYFFQQNLLYIKQLTKITTNYRYKLIQKVITT